MTILRSLFLWRSARQLVGKVVSLGLNEGGMDGELLAAGPLGVTLCVTTCDACDVPYDQILRIVHGPSTERDLEKRRARLDARSGREESKQASLDQDEIADLMRSWARGEPA